jgi:hypothetical protein
MRAPRHDGLARGVLLDNGARRGRRVARRVQLFLTTQARARRLSCRADEGEGFPSRRGVVGDGPARVGLHARVVRVVGVT